MAVRVVLAVAFAVVLVGASTPAVERARVDTADARVESEVGALLDAARHLRAVSDPVPPGTPGARLVVTLSLPRATWGRAPLRRLTVGRDRVTWRVAGGHTQVRHGTHPIRGAGPDGRLVLDAGGTARLELRLVTVEGRATVVVAGSR